MRKILLFGILIPILTSFYAITTSSKLQIEYKHTVKGINTYFTLVSDAKYSTLVCTDSDSPMYEKFKSNKDKGLFLDRTTGQIFSYSYFFKKEFYVMDNIQTEMKWILTNKSILILGYECKSATLSFRGRQYEAYYAKSLPISTGPFKFYGLPGAILDIRTTDQKYVFSAEAVSKLIDNNPIKDPYASVEKENWTTYYEYRTKLKKKFSEISKALKAKATKDDETTLMFESMEIF